MLLNTKRLRKFVIGRIVRAFYGYINQPQGYIPQVAQALDANKVRNFFLRCWATIGTLFKSTHNQLKYKI